jgi:Ni,Fe-hydrogenase I cytochrome b subunit
MNKEKNKKLPDFLYVMKLKTAIYGFILYLLLSHNNAFKILNMIFNNSLQLLNDKNEPSILARIIMAFIIAIILFIF